MLLASSCYLPEADAVMCESVGWEGFCWDVDVLKFHLKADVLCVQTFTCVIYFLHSTVHLVVWSSAPTMF